jgi:superfamily I DNA and/or RNA helicase
VVAGTCIGFLRHRAVRSLDIDLCIVDEASKATLTEALVPMARAKKWILVGDTRQLPPTDEDLLRATDVLRDNDLSREDVTQTLFRRMADQLPAHSQRLLRQQYRMIRPIGDMISTCFYEGQLVSPNEDGIPGYNVLFDKPVLWIDTAKLGDGRRESAPSGQSKSYANHAEAKLVTDRLDALERAIALNIVKPQDGTQRLEVLVIAPYKSQVEELQRRVASLSLNHLSPVVLSVDAVQGRESDVTFLSVTRSNARGELGFLGADYWRRINVALSRARFGLIVVGDAEFIRGTTGALKSVLDYITDNPNDCALRLENR